MGENITYNRARKYGILNEYKYINTMIDKITDGTNRGLRKQFLSSQETIYKEILNILGVKGNIPYKKFKKEIEFPWSGLTYDVRIRNHGDRFKTDIRKIITQGLRKGYTLEELLPSVIKRFDKLIDQIKFVQKVDTEHFINMASLLAYKRDKQQRVRWYTRIDERTCEVCGGLHLQEFDIDKTPTIPQHPNCRCRLVPIP